MVDSQAEPGVGHEFPAYEVSWNERDVLLFAVSVGARYPEDLRYLYERHPLFVPLPTYPTVLPFKNTSSSTIDFVSRSSSPSTLIPGVPVFDIARSLDGERHIHFLRPIPASSEGRVFEIRSRVVGVWDKGKAGSVVKTEQVLGERGGSEYVRMVGSVVFVGQGGWGGPRGPPSPPLLFPSRAPDLSSMIPTNSTTPHLYRLNGDYNPLHAIPTPSMPRASPSSSEETHDTERTNAAEPQTQQQAPILHGLFTLSATSLLLLRHFCSTSVSDSESDSHSDLTRLRFLGGRWTARVQLDDALFVEAWRMGAGSVFSPCSPSTSPPPYSSSSPYPSSTAEEESSGKESQAQAQGQAQKALWEEIRFRVSAFPITGGCRCRCRCRCRSACFACSSSSESLGARARARANGKQKGEETGRKVFEGRAEICFGDADAGAGADADADADAGGEDVRVGQRARARL